ncbi:MAG TPA: AraC family transcriptional regulator [Caulobacteraceae bacterium]|nr:AraC family transcriptional regulator [Caulobacteraceae bacterium]
MSLAKRALWVIERQLGRPLSLATVASSCGVTRHHLAHAFGEATGYSVMEYVRARRLTEAAAALAAGASDVLQVALDAGYESHEAFTRAFKARFAVTPREVRRRGSSRLALLPPLDLPEHGGAALLSPTIASASEIMAVGRRARQSFATTSAIPAQWRAFGPEIGWIRPIARPIPIGVMADLNDEGAFTYLCGLEVDDFAMAPADLDRVRIAPSRYAVFRHQAHVSELRRTYAAIWNAWFPQSGETPADAPIVERHDPSFRVETGYGGLEIWAPLGR